MINIGICDDDVAMTAIIEEMLHKIANEQDIKINCAVFFDGFTLVENIRQGTYYDLIYLDIEMHKINGISAAELIRSMEVPALIVYVSSYEKYLKELFNTEPFRFLSKPIIATVYKGNIIKNLIMDCQSYTKYRPNETTGGIFVSWRRKEELPTGA